MEIDGRLITIGMVMAVILGIIGTAQYEDLYSGSYKQCRIGRTYGEWLSTDTPLLYTCDMTAEESLCYKTTKTRCYQFDESKVGELLSTTTTTSTSTTTSTTVPVVTTTTTIPSEVRTTGKQRIHCNDKIWEVEDTDLLTPYTKLKSGENEGYLGECI